MDRYAVIGNPVAHSLSPEIHRLFAEQTGQRLDYQRLLASPDGFEEALRQFFDTGGCGINVTVPFKARAAAWVTVLDPDAAAAGAVNTIARDAAGFRGFNTDGSGLVTDLQRNHGQPIAGQRVLLVGAGGAARGVVRPLLREAPAALVVCNRTPARAEQLAAALTAGFAAIPISGHAFDRIGTEFDLVIHATSAARQAELPPLPETAVRGAFCYDMNYGARAAFRHWAALHQARYAVDGLGMLVEQAADAFHIWRGIRPATAAIMAALRNDRRLFPEESDHGY